METTQNGTPATTGVDQHGSSRGCQIPVAIRNALDALRQGVIFVNELGVVEVCSRQACALLGLPQRFAETPYSLTLLAAELGHIAVSDGGDAVILHRPPGSHIEISARPTARGGRLFAVEDITEDQLRERSMRQAESQYRSLFENTVYGIYRDTLDGMPVRVNPALAALNGYASEAEHIAAVQQHADSWYVDPSRGAELLSRLESDGRVSDFVSQVRRHRTGEPVWVTENAWYVRDEDGTPLFIEGTIQDATDRVMAAEALNRQARTDGLTGAASRFHFLEWLDAEVAKPGNSFVLYCIDLDLFKDINDVFGHAAGDDVLKAVASRFRSMVNAQNLVARLGGDEFAIVSLNPNDIRNPEVFGQAIIQAVHAPILSDGRSHVVQASVGIAVFPRHGDTASELLRNADTALYETKAKGRNGWRVFDQELRTAIAYRKAIETDLRGVTGRGELELHYQAIVDAADGSVAGFEGLMRWNSPRLGQVSPSEFIPVAEQSGLMMDLGAWAIARTCEDASIFHRNVHFSVNVSANQFRAPGLVAHVAQELNRSSLPPERLVLEVTESVLVSNETSARNLLNDLRRLGVQIAIDDFGTGYSSLSYLQHLPITIVKIDRSFVAGMLDQKANRAVIRAVLAIGRDLGFKIIAEGVETEEQARALRNEGCQFIQGFLYSRPKPLTDVVADLSAAILGRNGPPGILKTA